MHNQLVIWGTVYKSPYSMVSPAGIPIDHFWLDHRSQQWEADLLRTAQCRIQVVSSGLALHQIVTTLMPGDPIEVRGFITRRPYKEYPNQIELHAQYIAPTPQTKTI